MTHFRTIVTPAEAALKMGILDKIVTIGSCFADSIGSKMASSKMQTCYNPFGTLYNPLSIHKALEYSTNETLPPLTSYLQHDEVFLNYDFHSELNALTKDDLIQRLTQVLSHTRQFLSNAQWLVITYGTAWTYHRRDTGAVVANCHKTHKSFFEKSLLTTGDIEHSFESVYKALKKLNPAVNIILTLSPVRHLKDTLALNSVSKSVLRYACYTLTEKYKDVSYFPAYEIMLDDLRDYRFYKSDLIHPNELAETYIWERFSETYFKKELLDFLTKWKEISRAMNHKPFHAQTGAHQLFLRETLNMLDNVSSMVNVDKEKEIIQDQLLFGQTDVEKT